jgi:hypothetical protein
LLRHEVSLTYRGTLISTEEQGKLQLYDSPGSSLPARYIPIKQSLIYGEEESLQKIAENIRKPWQVPFGKPLRQHRLVHPLINDCHICSKHRICRGFHQGLALVSLVACQGLAHVSTSNHGGHPFAARLIQGAWGCQVAIIHRPN